MKNQLKLLRIQKALSQTEVAEKIGVSRQTIYAIEVGKYIPSVLIALKLAQLLEVPIEQIFQLTTED